jgi:hypothetical protein
VAAEERLEPDDDDPDETRHPSPKQQETTMSQLTYPTAPGGLKAGMKGDLVEDDVLSYLNTTGAVLPFGVMVALGAADDRLKRLASLTADKLIGVVIHDGITSQGASVTTTDDPFGTTPETQSYGVPDKRAASVMRKGHVWVNVETAVAAFTDAWVRVTATGSELVGAFRAGSDSGDCCRVKGARFLTSTSAAGLALLELDHPMIDDRDDIITLTVGAEAAVAANAREIAVAVTNPDGTAIDVARQLEISVTATTADKGDIAAAGTPVGTVDCISNPATGDNNAALLTTAGGLGAFRVTDDQVENVLVRVSGQRCKPAVVKTTFA